MRVLGCGTMKLTDKTECWLVWERAPDAETGGRPYLRAVDLTEDLAKRHRIAVVNEARLKGRQTMVMIEKSQINHLYGESMTKGYEELRAAFGKHQCPACGRMTRNTTAGCDHCELEDK
jgi:hypothetical protein